MRDYRRMTMAGIYGKANKVGRYGGNYDYAHPTDPVQHDPAAIGAMKAQSKGLRLGKTLSSAVGAGVAAVTGRKVGGVKIKGGKF
jgi:hypothetical protein